MALPDLRHFAKRGIFYISSDPVEALVGEAWVPAIYTDKGWASADGATLLPSVTEWRHGQEEGQGSQGDGRVQARDTADRQARPRQGRKGQKPEAGNSNRAE
jgi:hypothetical protein